MIACCFTDNSSMVFWYCSVYLFLDHFKLLVVAAFPKLATSISNVQSWPFSSSSAASSCRRSGLQNQLLSSLATSAAVTPLEFTFDNAAWAISAAVTALDFTFGKAAFAASAAVTAPVFSFGTTPPALIHCTFLSLLLSLLKSLLCHRRCCAQNTQRGQSRTMMTCKRSCEF